MSVKIGVISQSQEFIRLVCSFLNDPSIEVIVSQGYYYQAAEVAAKMVKEGVKIIIARERTADLVEKAVPISIVHCDFGPMEILTAFNKATPRHYPLACISELPKAGRTLSALQMIEELWGEKIEMIVYTEHKELDGLLQNAISKGVRGVIGGRTSTEFAAQYGLNTIELLTSQETAKNAAEKALLIAQQINYKDERKNMLTSVLNIFDRMYIVTDQNGDIITLNTSAERVTGLAFSNNVKEFFADSIFARHLNRVQRGETIKDDTYMIPGTSISFLYTLFPMINSNGNTEAILMCIEKNDKVSLTREKSKQNNLTTKYSFDDIIGESPCIVHTKILARRYAKSMMNILIDGETGTGKELFAHSIHKCSERAAGPFVAINCASIPASLLESELFGYEDGAFTGAKKGGKVGLFELANGGSLFLDEVGELPLDIQARLLRVLQSKEIMRLGGNRQIPIDVRIISATNKDLNRAVQSGEFRSDLYYRLNTLILNIPPLRERKDDIPALVNVFLDGIELPPQEENRVVNHINDLIKRKATYSWPGNVRELQNFVTRCTVECDITEEGIICDPDLLLNMSMPSGNGPNSGYESGKIIASLQDNEIEQIRHVGEKVDWDRRKMTEILGISASTLWRKMKKFNIAP